ncbi:MAG TPA: DNA repair protein RadA [Treponemataceae bacterium]|nr:DNA repair protein RadA [Treponemataceae bacterium]
MAKKKIQTVFKCSNCEYTQPRWMGRCPKCGEWNTLQECTLDKNSHSPAFAGSRGAFSAKAKPIPLANIDPMEGTRISTGISEFDRVLGGGAMKRSAVLIGGEPGIGKSTLLLQTLAAVATKKARVLYVSGEESANQIRARADRLELNCANIEILCTTKLEDIEDALNSINPIIAIIDSIQTVYSHEAGLVPATINQLKYCAHELISWVKERDAVLCMSAHITKEGNIAGPKSLEHMVDTVISFERNSDEIRFLRSLKNRFGSTDELGLFAMSKKGLSVVEDPSTLFITRRTGTIPAGIAIVPVFEGSRVFMVEVQALVVPAKASFTRVYSDKIDTARVSRIAAVLEKRAGIKLSDQDIYINVAGGFRLTESAVDAGLAAALYSARTDMPLKAGSAVVGEISLAGEIRPVTKLKQRVKAAQTLGFTTVICPEHANNCLCVQNIKELVQNIF